MSKNDGVILTGIVENFDDYWSSFNNQKTSCYKNRSLSLEFINSYKNLSIEEKKYSVSILFNYIEENHYDFFVSTLLIIGLNKLGKVKDSKNVYQTIAQRLVRTKKFHRLIELNEYLSDCNLSDTKEFQKIAKLGLGNVENIDGNKFILDRVSFNDMKLNSSIYFKNTFVLKKFVDYIEVYSELDVVEAILKAVPVIPIDNHFLKALEKISNVTASENLAKSVITVIEGLGQSFGVNIDALKNVKREEVVNSQREVTQLNYRAPIDLEQKKIVGTNYGKDSLEQAMNAKDSGDYLLAIGLFREIIFEGNINKETYLKCVTEITNCYKKLGNKARANKLESFLKRKTVE